MSLVSQRALCDYLFVASLMTSVKVSSALPHCRADIDLSSAGPCLAPASFIRTGLQLIRVTSNPQGFELKMAILPARDVPGWYTAGAY